MTKKDKKELIQKPRGMHDILPRNFLIREKFIEKAKAVADFYGFKPIQTPILEKSDLFTATVGENTDIVEKEMYNLKTKGGNKLVLRPEGTAPIVRAYLEHGMHTKPQPVMFYYFGSFFRHERPQKGRRREFQQFGLEILGEEDSITDALVIKASLTIIEEAAGLKPVCVHVNSVGCKECRKVYLKELVSFYRKKMQILCSDCKNRIKTNPMRLLDCKDEKCATIKPEAPQIINYLCDPCSKHFKQLLEILDVSEIPYYLNNYLVRGLDYYSRTAFELFLENESMELGGGGRYDELSLALSNKKVPAVGMAIGVDRILETLKEKGKLKITEKPPKVFFIQLGAAAKQKSLSVIEKLRKEKITTKHSLSKNSLKSQLKIAEKLKVPFTIILGQKETLENNIMVRDMETNSQETVSLDKLTDYLKKKIK